MVINLGKRLFVTHVELFQPRVLVFLLDGALLRSVPRSSATQCSSFALSSDICAWELKGRKKIDESAHLFRWQLRYF